MISFKEWLNEQDLNEAVKFNGKLKYAEWSDFTAKIGKDEFNIEAKVFEEPSDFGIDNGKISKLRITNKTDSKQEINYDRGWDIKPHKSGSLKKVYDEFIKQFN